MITRTCSLIAVLLSCLVISQTLAQEGPGGQPGQPAARPTGPAPPSGVDQKYIDLSHSKDAKTKGLADRYIGLVRFQDWGTASGKSTMAKYVSHDPDLRKVKLAFPRGSGKDRVIKEFDIEVATLNKVCQARVKQIDTLQKKLDELAANAKPGDTAGAQAGPGGSPEGAGPGGQVEQRRTNRRNARGPEGEYAAGPGATPPAQPGEQPPAQAAPAGPDPSEAEPDPLGFAELPPVTPPAQVGPGAVPANPLFAGGRAKTRKAAGQADRKQWRNNLAAFMANITVTIDPNGQSTVDWGELNDVRQLNDLAVAQKTPGAAAPSPEAETPAAISERLGDMQWQLVVDKVEQAPGGMVEPHFRAMPIPKPLEMQITLDEKEDQQKWASLVPGAPVNVLARLTINEPNKIVVKVRMGGP